MNRLLGMQFEIEAGLLLKFVWHSKTGAHNDDVQIFARLDTQ